jgi:O-succinylbenzoic acid--CoA ligase
LIISGGEKVNPTEVEAALRTAGGAALADVVVVGVPSAEWGNEVVALLCGDAAFEPKLRAELTETLAPAKRPKRYVWVAVEAWPRDARGKVNRTTLAELAR